ncbi:MAG: hypothetical protein Ct9H300mP7_3640 [Verrucomicrobiota bacterium]|nr:MAG: hypothetical protein Ct9H300mP7_3640 [Verrucomicrobiota bacterium]
MVATETGGVLITPYQVPRHQTRVRHPPFFGVKPALVDDEGNVIEGTTFPATFAYSRLGPVKCAPCTATNNASSNLLCKVPR